MTFVCADDDGSRDLPSSQLSQGVGFAGNLMIGMCNENSIAIASCHRFYFGGEPHEVGVLGLRCHYGDERGALLTQDASCHIGHIVCFLDRLEDPLA
ncbi:hypothetical protein HMPREF1626_00630 [Actinomyces urogenitalis S6-C4]|nr:hypothetical protein HMPREF1626_00630 [Actinomyces urogenitalis S6-C4]